MNVSKEMAASAEARDFTNPKAFFDLFKDLFHAVTTKILTPLTHQNADIALQYCKVSIALTTNDLLAINSEITSMPTLNDQTTSASVSDKLTYVFFFFLLAIHRNYTFLFCFWSHAIIL